MYAKMFAKNLKLSTIFLWRTQFRLLPQNKTDNISAVITKNEYNACSKQFHSFTSSDSTAKPQLQMHFCVFLAYQNTSIVAFYCGLLSQKSPTLVPNFFHDA